MTRTTINLTASCMMGSIYWGNVDRIRPGMEAWNHFDGFSPSDGEARWSLLVSRSLARSLFFSQNPRAKYPIPEPMRAPPPRLIQRIGQNVKRCGNADRSSVPVRIIQRATSPPRSLHFGRGKRSPPIRPRKIPIMEGMNMNRLRDRFRRTIKGLPTLDRAHDWSSQRRTMNTNGKITKKATSATTSFSMGSHRRLSLSAFIV